MTDTLPESTAVPAVTSRPGAAAVDSSRVVDWRRLAGVSGGVALAAALVAAVGSALGTVVAGRLAEQVSWRLIGWLTLCVVGAAVINSIGRVVWSAISDRAEGRLRADLLTAALHQPLEQLTEQAVGEILDRVDDDTHEVGNLVRQQVWSLFGTVFGCVPMWIVAGVTWWPAFLVFPAVAAIVVVLVRPLLAKMTDLKISEEAAWTDHAAALEEGIAGRNDLRTSLGQAHVIRRLAQLSAEVHRRFGLVVRVEAAMTRRTGGTLHVLLAAVAVVGVWLVTGGHMSVARMVTLFLVTTNFVGQIDQLARHLPDLQAGLGALARLRQMLETPPEPPGGLALPSGPEARLDLELRDLSFQYAEGTFGLHDVTLTVPAGQTVALVGRTGSGKSTLASLLSRAVEPPRGSVFLGGLDVCDLDLQRLRAAVGVVTQRTEILAGTLAENIALFASTPRAEIEAAVAELGLTEWVAGLPEGLDTLLGPGGTSLSAGEEQLVAFARLLVRDVQVVVLDEATARMDPLTERRVVAAADRLLTGRTGILVAHRLTTVERADLVVVLDRGRVIQSGRRTALAAEPGPFRTLLEASATESSGGPGEPSGAVAAAIGGRRRSGPAPQLPEVGTGPSLARGMLSVLTTKPWWGIGGWVGFMIVTLIGAAGALTGWVWGHLVEHLQAGERPVMLTALMVLSLVLAPLVLSDAVVRYPKWWIEVMLRARMNALVGQTRTHRLTTTPPGEVVARSMDADRYARYGDRWVDFTNGLVAAVITGLVAGSALAGAVPFVIMLSAAVASAIGRPIAGRSAARSSAARARFGRSLVSALESARTVKLAAATPEVHAHLRKVDAGRVEAAVYEHRIQAILDGVPVVMVQVGMVAAWALMEWGAWGLATALLVSNAVAGGFDWFGRVAGSVVTEAPGTRSWQQVMSRYAGGVDLMQLPAGVDLVTGDAPEPVEGVREPLRELALRRVSAIHDDGTIGASGVELTVTAGELVLLLGSVGSGKSSLLSSLAGLVAHTGEIHWNGTPVTDAEAFLRPGRVAHVAQVPRVLSGTFRDNLELGFDREFERPIEAARLSVDIADAGGPDALVGHRGVRLSGGQVQRLALARALAADTELLLADDVSSALDAATEIELWQALRDRGTTVIGSTSKRAALAQADRVVVLVDGVVAGVGPWTELATTWGHLAG